MPPDESGHDQPDTGTEADLSLERGPALSKQVEAGIALATIGELRVGQSECGLRDVELGSPGSLRQLLDGVPVTVPGGEAHLAVGALRGQGMIDEADALHEVGPVEEVDLTEAGHDVAYRDVGGRLPTMGFADYFVG